VLVPVTTGRHSEVDWLYYGVRRFLPEAWEHFRNGVPPEDRNGDLLAAHARLLGHPDAEVRLRAAPRPVCLGGQRGVSGGVRLDLSGPPINAWELSRVWPDARLRIFGGSGHKGNDAMAEELIRALDAFARA